MRIRALLLLVVGWATAVAQESRPIGLLPVESPLAPAQEALLRGDLAEARAAIDLLLHSAPEPTLRSLGEQIALLRAATQPVDARAEAMLAVASAYPNRPVAEAAAVAGLASLLSDAPEVGDLSTPLLGARGASPATGDDEARQPALSGRRRDDVIGALVEILSARAGAADRDVDAIEHARRLLAGFPSQSTEWIVVRPGQPTTIPASLGREVRLRLYEVRCEGGLPDPTHLALPSGPPAIDVTFPTGREAIELPAIPPGAWLAVASGPHGHWRRTWAILASDLELIVHSVPGSVRGLGILGGQPVEDPGLVRFLDARIASRTRSAQPSGADNSVMATVGGHLASAPIATQKAEKVAGPRIVADVWAAQPVYRPGDRLRMRVVVRPLPGGPVAEVPLRVVLWPRQAHEVVIEEHVTRVLAVDRELPKGVPPGPVRAQVFDDGWNPAGRMPEPVLDTVAFSVQSIPADPVQVLLSAPASWRPGDPSPAIGVRANLRDGSPVTGLRAVVSLAAGSLRQEAEVVLDDEGSGSVGLDLAGLPPAMMDRLERLDLTARLMARDRELARASRTVEVVRTAPRDDEPALALEVPARRPIAGEPVLVTVLGPAGESVLLTADCRGVLQPFPVRIGADGRATVAIPTEPAWWPSIDLACSTRQLPDPVRQDSSGRPWVRGPLTTSARVALARAGAPSIEIEAPASCGAGDPVAIEVRVVSAAATGNPTLSVAIVDDQLLALAGTGLPDPDANMRPAVGELPRTLAASPLPLRPADWFAAILGSEDRSTLPPPDLRATPTRPARTSPRASAAAHLGAWDLSGATAHFAPDVPLGADGRATIRFEGPARARRWRVIAVAIDDNGASAVASRTMAGHARAAVRSAPPEGTAASIVTTARIFLTGSEPRGRLQPAEIPGAVDQSAAVAVFPFPGGIAALLEETITRASDCADHLAARILRSVTLLGHAPLGTSPGTDARASIEADMVALRELKTRDGYAWKRGGATDFEATPIVLHALSVAAAAGVDPAEFDAVPEGRDGFLRAASRCFADAQGNPQAALDLEEIRNHEAFTQSVPPDRRALVLVDTVIGMLAVDPTAALPKSAVAGLVRQSQALPGSSLARAGLALMRAGDRESAAIARKRLDGIPVLEDDVPRLALEIELGGLLDDPAETQATLVRSLAGMFARSAPPRVFDSAIALSALRSRYGLPPRDAAGIRMEAVPSTPVIEVVSDGPALCVATRESRLADRVPASGTAAPVRRLATGASPEGGVVQAALQEPRRFEISADSPGRSCALVCPIPDGMHVLDAGGAAVGPTRLLGRTDEALVWMFRTPAPDARLRVETMIAIEDGVRWDPCRLVDLETLEILGWSASLRLEATQAETRAGDSGRATLLDVASLARAREGMQSALGAAGDPASRARALADLVNLPDPSLPDAILSSLEAIAPLLDTPEALAPVLVALGDRRAELWSPASLQILSATSSSPGLAALAEGAREYPEARGLVARWAEAPGHLTQGERTLAGLMAIARMRSSDPADVRDLWEPETIRRLLSVEDAGGPPVLAERIAAAKELPFARNFARMSAAPSTANDERWDGWTLVLEALEREVRGPAVTQDLVALAAAITEPPPVRSVFVTGRETAFHRKRGVLRAIAADRAVSLIETRALPLEAATLPMITEPSGPDLVPRLLRFLEGEVAEGRADRAVPVGIEILDRRRETYRLDDLLGPRLAGLAISGPRAWRLPALLALAPPERARLPLLAVEFLLRDPDSHSAAIDLLLERDDVADRLRAMLEGPVTRYDARRILERLVQIEPRPFERAPLGQILSLLAGVDGQTPQAVVEEIGRRADENPIEIAAALAASRDEKARDALVLILGRMRFTDVPWEDTDQGAEKHRTKLMALAGDPGAAATVRTWMAGALQASQTQGAPEAAVQELWPHLAPSATPLDVLTFGAPTPLDPIEPRIAAWSDADIRDFLASPEAEPDATAGTTRFGSVATVVRLIGPKRASAFADEIHALWRAHAGAGLAFEALSLFGQMGRGQGAVFREVLGSPSASRPAFDESQQLAYVAALRRDGTTYEEIEPIFRTGLPASVAKGLARYAFEVTGYWREPAASATQPAALQGPHDWERALTIRLRNRGLDAIRDAEPPVLEAWTKALRERGLLLR